MKNISDTLDELSFDEGRMVKEFLLTDDHAPIEYLMAKQ